MKESHATTLVVESKGLSQPLRASFTDVDYPLAFLVNAFGSDILATVELCEDKNARGEAENVTKVTLPEYADDGVWAVLTRAQIAIAH